jgi:hypothetical protein
MNEPYWGPIGFLLIVANTVMLVLLVTHTI